MLDVYARSFLTATRTDNVRLREMPPKTDGTRRRWFTRRPTIDIDPAKL